MDIFLPPPRRSVKEAVQALLPSFLWSMDGSHQGLIRDLGLGGWHATVTGTNEVQTVTLGGTPTGGSFTLTCGGQTTGAINWSSNNTTLLGNIDTALELLSGIGSGGVTCAAGTLTLGIGTLTVTFGGSAIAGKDFQLMTADGTSLTGTAPTVSVAATTAGGPQYRAGGNALGDGDSINWSGSGQFAQTSSSIPPPVGAISVMAVMKTTDATAAARYLASRGGTTNHWSWSLTLTASHLASFTAFQAGGSAHAAASVGTFTCNLGDWIILLGTFDGTTIYAYQAAQKQIAIASSASLTGSWNKDATVAVTLAALGATTPSNNFPGRIGLVAMWYERILGKSELASVAQALR